MISDPAGTPGLRASQFSELLGTILSKTSTPGT
jgi:hypothetical protein